MPWWSSQIELFFCQSEGRSDFRKCFWILPVKWSSISNAIFWIKCFANDLGVTKLKQLKESISSLIKSHGNIRCYHLKLAKELAARWIKRS